MISKIINWRPATVEPEKERMYVCICKGITDTQIRATIEAGACSLRDVRNSLGVTSQCGKCGVLAQQIVQDAMADSTSEQNLFYALS
jgi:bacterioferritin-associated ferredoxin